MNSIKVSRLHRSPKILKMFKAGPKEVFGTMRTRYPIVKIEIIFPIACDASVLMKFAAQLEKFLPVKVHSYVYVGDPTDIDENVAVHVHGEIKEIQPIIDMGWPR